MEPFSSDPELEDNKKKEERNTLLCLWYLHIISAWTLYIQLISSLFIFTDHLYTLHFDLCRCYISARFYRSTSSYTCRIYTSGSMFSSMSGVRSIVLRRVRATTFISLSRRVMLASLSSVSSSSLTCSSCSLAHRQSASAKSFTLVTNSNQCYKTSIYTLHYVHLDLFVSLQNLFSF